MKNLIIVILIILILYFLYLNSKEDFDIDSEDEDVEDQSLIDESRCKGLIGKSLKKCRHRKHIESRCKGLGGFRLIKCRRKSRKERRSRRRSRARNKRKRIAARRRRRTKKLFGGIKYMFNKVTKGVGNIAKRITDKIKMNKSKCWKMMPTGCDNKLIEKGSGGHGRDWFKDKHAKGILGCRKSTQRFNDYCNRTDAKSYWGKKPNTLNQKFLDGLEQKTVEDKKKYLTNKIDEYLSNLNNMKTEMVLGEQEENAEDKTTNEFEDDLEDDEPEVNLFSNEYLFNNKHPENIEMQPKPFKYEYVGFNKNLNNNNCSELNGWAKINCRIKKRKNKKIEGRI